MYFLLLSNLTTYFFLPIVLSIIFEMYHADLSLSVVKFVILIVLLGAHIEKMSRNQYKIGWEDFGKKEK